MADDLQDAPWALPPIEVSDKPSALPDAPWTAQPKQEEGYVAETKRVANRALDTINTGFNPEERAKHSVLENTMNVGKAALAVPQLAMSPLTGAIRNYGGQGVKEITDKATAAAQSIFGGKREEMPLEAAKDQAETMSSALMPSRASLPRTATAPIPPMPKPNGHFDVTLSAGQKTGELPLITEEQAALKGQSGPAARAHAEEFQAQQRAELDAARERVAGQLDPFGQRVVESPREAGELVSNTLQSEAARSKAGVKQAYDVANAQPGEFDLHSMLGLGNRVKNELAARPSDPITVDSLTPNASRALDYLDNGISKLSIPNKAQQAPNSMSIAGVNLKGIEQVRKNLSQMRSDAFSNFTNKTDQRAMQQIVESFDKKIDEAIAGGHFNGPPEAIRAWQDARAAHAQDRRTFGSGKNDPVGRVVGKIIGRGDNPAAIPNDVADFMYGTSGVNPNSLNVNVVKRLQKILGDKSPEWSAVKQGLFERLTSAGEGVTDFGPAKIAQRMNRFMNGDGKELADVLFAPHERQLLQSYADLQRQIEVPRVASNPSNTSTFVSRSLQALSDKFAPMVGAIIGHHIFPGLGLVGDAAGAGATKVASALGNRASARQIARQMPIVATAMKNWQQAVAKANKLNSPPSGVALTYATQNLARALRPFGITMQDILPAGAMPSAAQDNQPKRDGGRANQPDGDAGNKQRAAGGRVIHENINHTPTEAQKKAGNYAKDHIHIHGLDITIENACGKYRSGTDEHGKTWRCKLPAHYGYLKNTEGADGDHVDVYVGPHIKSDKAFVIDQMDHKTGSFDEHKSFLGFTTKQQVVTTYKRAFSDDKAHLRLGAITECSIAEFKNWLARGDTKQPAAA